jgi:hypothetical protein
MKMAIHYINLIGAGDNPYGKEVQIILRLFMVHHLLLQTKSVSPQPASNVGGLAQWDIYAIQHKII